MEFIIGLKTKDFVLMGSDKNGNQGIVKMINDNDRIFRVGESNLITVSGEDGRDIEFAEFMTRNFDFHEYKNGVPMTTKALAALSRDFLSGSLRSRSGPIPANILIGGCDSSKKTTELFLLDYLGSKVPFGCHGYGSFFALSILDRLYKEDMSENEAVQLLELILNEVRSIIFFKLLKLRKRFVVNIPTLLVKIINTENNFRTLEIGSSG